MVIPAVTQAAMVDIQAAAIAVDILVCIQANAVIHFFEAKQTYSHF